MRIGKREFEDRGKVYIMGILNVTPDSFSDGGRYDREDLALFRAEEMLREGADILDIGGESTRPGFHAVSEEEEIRRTESIIRKIRRELDPVISIDTYKPGTAEAAASAGADMVNDIWGFRKHEEMAGVAARHGLSCCLMHNREKPVYGDLMEDIRRDLQESLLICERAGIPKDRIMLDPGIGFGKTQEMNLEVIRRSGELLDLGRPLLIGASRKSVIGHVLDLPVEERLEGTLAISAWAALHGASFVRVHDIKANRRLLDMLEAIRES